LMWAVVVPIAARLVPPTHTGRATTAVYAGTTVALVIGNPLTTAMSEAWGWRQAVAVLAVAAAVTTLLAQGILPRMAADAGAPGSSTPRRTLPYRNKRLITLCALTFVGVTAHFVSFTFIVPLIRDVVGVGGPAESWVYAGYGVVGLLALVTLSPAVDRRVRPAAAGAAAILCLAFWCLSGLVGGSGVLALWLGITAILVWGAAAALLPPLLQSAAIRTCPGQPEQASALYVTTFQVGIVAGSIGGGLVYAQGGIAAVVAASSVLFAVALAGVLFRGEALEPGAPPSLR
jgi:predicted MFS family arabinose efflux permease